MLAQLATGAAVAGIPGAALAAEPADPHPAWARLVDVIRAQLDTPGLIADADTGPFCERLCGFYDLIATTRAQTLTGVREQIALVADSIFHNQPGETEKAALANALATLERLAGEGAHV